VEGLQPDYDETLIPWHRVSESASELQAVFGKAGVERFSFIFATNLTV